MKREYSSPVMEVEIFEASEYVAACYTCYYPAKSGGAMYSIGTDSEEIDSNQSQKGVFYRDLYIENGKQQGLQLSGRNQDTGVFRDNICYEGSVKSDSIPQDGYWTGNDLAGYAWQYKKVKVIQKDGIAHVVNPNGTNAS
ncbi:hypothetical protein [Intestinibacter bartlettii]|uniref:Uncharacterized protein n=1 Tax=Intestinibacter bartlettii TaxID=261299 RepID=A0ABS6DXH0_9FIRM|nr:hypothetical protein [Intestinibacter bartlettii]MBU5336550.1 hypothetical protein [Intestinibacter bartlettii]